MNSNNEGALLPAARGMATSSSTSADALDEDWWLAAKEEGEDRRGRKRSGVDPRGDADHLASKAKRKRKRRPKLEDVEQEQEEAFSALHSASRQRDELSTALQSRLEDTPSPVEANVFKLKKSFFAAYQPPVASGGEQEEEKVPSFSEFVSRVCPAWKELLENVVTNGSPAVVVISVSALRATDLRRQLLKFSGSHTVGKLFARHMKIEEQSLFLSTHVTPIAVATPERLKQLMDTNALSSDELKLVIIDWYWRDQKLRRFSDVPEVWQSFVALYQSHLHRLIRAKQTKIILF